MSIKRIAWGGLFAIYFFSGCTTAQPDQTIDRLMLERSLADARKQLEEIEHRLSVIQFMVDSHEKAIIDLKRSEAIDAVSSFSKPAALTIESPSSNPPAADEYDQAFSALKAAQYADAASRFSDFARNHPNHDLADNALYWAGECFYAERKYIEAISAFNKVLERYPGQNKAPDALLKIGYACLAIEDSEGAKHHLNRVIQEYPQSEAAMKARQKLPQIPGL